MKILFASHNYDKYIEAKEIFKKNLPDLNLISLNDLKHNNLFLEPIENGKTFFDNALIKAKYYYSIYNVPVISDDSGLVVEALNGEPGIYSARYSQNTNFESNMDRLLFEMQNKTNRKAFFACSLVYFDGVNTLEGKGKIDGKIAYSKKGSNGFGYDPIFIVNEYNLTFAQMEQNVKSKISHRAKAIKDLAYKLKNLK